MLGAPKLPSDKDCPRRWLPGQGPPQGFSGMGPSASWGLQSGHWSPCSEVAGGRGLGLKRSPVSGGGRPIQAAEQNKGPFASGPALPPPPQWSYRAALWVVERGLCAISFPQPPRGVAFVQCSVSFPASCLGLWLCWPTELLESKSWKDLQAPRRARQPSPGGTGRQRKGEELPMASAFKALPWQRSVDG